MRSFSGFATRVGLLNNRDLTVEVPDSQLVDARFAWIEPLESSKIVGDIKRYAESAGVKPARIPGYWLFKKGANELGIPPMSEGEKVVYHLHGGAFYIGSAHPSDPTAKITRGLMEHTQSVRHTFAVDYRLSASHPFPPANPFPAALLDALAGYHYLVNSAHFQPKNIILLGDSAGGTLGIAMIRYLVENEIPSLPPPGGYVSLSGGADMSMSRNGPESSAVKNNLTDIFNVPPNTIFAEYGIKSLLGPLDFEEAKTNRFLSPASPYISPDFTNFPKTYIAAGGAERILDDSTVLAARMRECTKDENWVLLDVPEDAVHDFCVFVWHEPERTQVLQRIGEWISNL